jgi:serine/threonine protein kinase
MGEVYKARDTRLDRTVAVKILPSHLSENPEAKQRFDREARTISSLNHPNICTLHDVGAQDGVDYLVMEYLEGETLADRLRKGPLTVDQVRISLASSRGSPNCMSTLGFQRAMAGSTLCGGRERS